MPQTTAIRSPKGQIRGFLDHHPDKIRARSASGYFLGWYDIKSNRTMSADGTLMSYGNTVVTFIPQ